MAETKEVYWLVTRAGEGLPDGARFWKELIREGEWQNARAGFTLLVDRDRLERWRDRFAAMGDAGIRVPVPWGHSYDPRDNAGFVEEVELRDGGLWGLLNVPDAEDAAKLGKTVQGVSVSINPDFVDGTGRGWGEVIEHVALTNYPVVTDQGEFLQAGTDGAERRAVMLELQAPDSEPQSPATELQTPADESQTPDPKLQTASGELETRLYLLELERAERDVDDAVRLGKFTRPAAEALRQLVAAGIERRYSFGPPDGGTGPGAGDVAQLARDIIANTPAGAAVDLAEHTRVHVAPDPSEGMTEARAAQLAKENKKLAGV